MKTHPAQGDGSPRRRKRLLSPKSPIHTVPPRLAETKPPALATASSGNSSIAQNDRPYGDLTTLNTDLTVLGAVGRELLQEIVSDILELLGTSCAVYEKNGDYALDLFSTGWCQFLDQASFLQCETRDSRQALASGRWHCHESCWTHGGKVAITTGQPAETRCEGGLQLYAMPIFARNQVVGAINCIYGQPPTDAAKLAQIAERYGVKVEELRYLAEQYQHCPPPTIELARKRMATVARMIGLVVERKQAEARQMCVNRLMEQLLFARPVQEEMQLIADAVVRMLDADFARIWIIKPSDLCNAGCVHARSNDGPHACRHRDRCLHLIASAGRYTHLDGPNHRRVPYGAYKIGRLASGDESYFITNNLMGDERVHDPEWARALGLRSFGGFRLLSSTGAPIGVLALFSRHEIGSEEDTLLRSLTNITAQVLQTAVAEEERLKLEQQIQHAQKLESLGVLAGGIAHDFNNLLTAILGNLSLALDTLSPASPARTELQEAEKATRRAADLAKQMLAYSGKGRFQVQRLDLREVIEEMSHMLQVSISKKAVLRYHFAASLPAIEADATQVRQIIMNLVINASEAIGDRSGVIAVSTGALDCDQSYLEGTWCHEPLPEGFYVYLEVADTGCGIPRTRLDRIFEPFYTTKFTGRGLGLAAVLGIVRSHKGAIKVYSEEGKGTTFKVLFRALNAPSDKLESALADGPAWHGSGLLLLVDDEESVRAIGKKTLERLGFQVLTASDGRQALEVYQSHAHEIVGVVLDLTMPHMDGEETFRELRRIQPDVRVIISSGYNKQDVVQRFAGKRLAGFVQKPYTLFNLRDVLRRVFATAHQ
jgi:signal transduction histidine kinase/CheY-like chemotaxis protein/ligand-binding sensor protein